jgi:large subunit ribosomal protein L29
VRIEKLSEMGDDELRNEEDRLAEQIFRFRFQLQTGNVENPSRLGHTRRDLARVKTLIRERALGIERHRRAAAEERERGGGDAAPAKSKKAEE